MVKFIKKYIFISLLAFFSLGLSADDISDVKNVIIQDIKNSSELNFDLSCYTRDYKNIDKDGVIFTLQDMELLIQALDGRHPYEFAILEYKLNNGKNPSAAEQKNLKESSQTQEFIDLYKIEVSLLQNLIKDSSLLELKTISFKQVEVRGNTATVVYQADSIDDDFEVRKFISEVTQCTLRKEKDKWKICEEKKLNEKIKSTAESKFKKIIAESIQTAEKKQAFIDAAQMLTEVLYVIEKTGRFDIAEKQILNNAKIGKIPQELRSISKRIIDTCHQGKLLLEDKKTVDDEFSTATLGIGIKAGIRLGSAIAMEDPVSAIWSVYQGYADFSSATSRKNQRINNILSGLSYRINSDKYDLRNKITENAEKYDVNPEKIISFDSLEEIEKHIKDFKDKPDIITQFINAYPYYTKLRYYLIKYDSKSFGEYKNILAQKNLILINDYERLNVAAEVGYKCAWAIVVNSKLPKDLYGDIIKILNEMVEYGLTNGGYSSGVFYFLRGVANSLAEYYGFSRPTTDDIWSDLLYSKPLNQGEYLKLQSLWCASWLATKYSSEQENELSDFITATFKAWKPWFIMQNTPFSRKDTAQEVYKKCMKVKWGWNINWGIFNDDIVIHNHSDFPLTNVKLQVTLKKKATDEIVWEKEITCEYIAPGKQHKWRDIMSIENGSHSTISGTASLTCDEDNVVNLTPKNREK